MDSPFRTSLSCVLHWLVFIPLLYGYIYKEMTKSCAFYLLKYFVYFFFFFSIGKSILNWSCVFLENNWSLVDPSWSLGGLSCSVAV